MYVVFTDTDCNVTPKLAEELGLKLIYMPFTLNGVEHLPYEGGDFDYHEYYDMLRKGAMPTTSAINPYQYREYFEEYFKNGIDILYIHFSKKMSGTFNSLTIAVNELKEEYPNVRFEMFDTMAIAGTSLSLIIEASKLYKNGKSMDEVIAFLEAEKNHFASYFMVDNLDFLRRSGRVSDFSAIVGNLVGLRPILKMELDGSLQVCAKALGRTKAIEQVINFALKVADHPEDHIVLLTHTDSLDTIKIIQEELIKRYGHLNIMVDAVNQVIGAHCGPDCVCITIHSKDR